MYKIARDSTVRMILDAVQPFSSRISYYEWDGWAEGFKLPKNDLIGLVSFGCAQDGEFHDLHFGIAVMTLDDPGLERSTQYVDIMYDLCRAAKKYPIFRVDGSLAGFDAIFFDGTAVAPMGRVDTRPTVELTVSARLTRAGSAP